MPHLLDNRVAMRVANRPLFPAGQSNHALMEDVGKDLSVLRQALPRLCQRLLEEPGNYVRAMSPPANALDVSLLPCFQALERLWAASCATAVGMPIIHGTRRFTSRLLDVCDQALEWSRLALKHGHFEAGNPDIEGDLDALVHILQVASKVALWHIQWALLDGSHSSTRSASTLRALLELQRCCPASPAFKSILDETRQRLMQACLLCLARLGGKPADDIYRASALLQGIPRATLLQCFEAGKSSPGPHIVFAFNDVYLTQVSVGHVSPRLGIGIAAVQEHFRYHDTVVKSEGLGSLASLLRQLGEVDDAVGEGGAGRRFARVSLGLGSILRKRQEWLEFLPWPSGMYGDEGARVFKACFGTLRASQHLFLRQCSGNVVAVQPSPEDPVSLCLITSVDLGADRFKRLHLQLLSTNWFIDSVQPLDATWEESPLFSGSVILARCANSAQQEHLMIVEMDLRLPRPSVLPTRFRLKSSGAVYKRVGPPRHLWGSVCMKIVSSDLVAMVPAMVVSNSLH